MPTRRWPGCSPHPKEERCAASRSSNPSGPLSAAFGSSLLPVKAEDLAAGVIKALVHRSGIDPERIEDVAFAQSYANSEAPCIGRWAALHAGLPIGEVPGFQVDRRCGGGLQAVITAAMTVQTGAADVVVAGGVESMSNIEHYTTTARWGSLPLCRPSTTGSTAAAGARGQVEVRSDQRDDRDRRGPARAVLHHPRAGR